MPESQVEVKPIGVVYYCNECLSKGNKVELSYLGIALTSNPPKYKHQCPKCAKLEELDKSYPTIRWLLEKDIEK